MSGLTFSEFVYVVLLALLPVSEVRGAIPLAYYIASNGLLRSYLVVTSILANCLLPVVLVPTLKYLEGLLIRLGRHNGLIARFVDLYMAVVGDARRRSRKYLDRWGYLGLTIFVAIPLPGTGAWTGSLVAYVFDLNKAKSILSIVVGVIIASALVILAMEGVLSFLKVFL